MALSKTCIEQHNKEEAITRKWLCWGLVCAAGFHAALVPLLVLNPISAREELERIELIVTAPAEPEIPIEPEPEPEIPEEPTPLPRAERPEEPESLREPEEPQTPEALEDPVEEPSEVPDTADSQEAPAETPTPEPTRPAALPTRVAAVSSGPSLAVPTGSPDGEGEAAPSGNSESNGTEESGSGEESGTTAAGPRTRQGRSQFGCRSCVRPDYPEEALEDDVEGQPAVEFEVDADGNVISARLVQSSGSAALDQAALDAVRQSSFTSGGQGRARTIEVDFSIEGSERNRAARRRGERRTVEESAPVEEPVPAEEPTLAEESAPDTAQSESSEPSEETEPSSPAALPISPEPDNEASDATVDDDRPSGSVENLSSQETEATQEQPTPTLDDIISPAPAESVSPEAPEPGSQPSNPQPAIIPSPPEPTTPQPTPQTPQPAVAPQPRPQPAAPPPAAPAAPQPINPEPAPQPAPATPLPASE